VGGGGEIRWRGMGVGGPNSDDWRETHRPVRNAVIDFTVFVMMKDSILYENYKTSVMI
jgi:hypothetical protein